MRITRIAATVGVSALLVGALSACGSSGKPAAAAAAAATSAAAGGGAGGAAAPGAAEAKARLLLAAAVMQKAGSSKLTISSSDAATGDGAGEYAWGAKPELDLSQQSGGGTKIREVDGVRYVGLSSTQALALGGKHWVKLESTGPTAGVDASLQAMTLMIDPAAQLAVAAANGKLSTVGTESLNGAQTTHVQSVMPTEALVKALPNLSDAQRTAVLGALKGDGSTVTSDFWLDTKNQLVQLKEAGSDGASTAASASPASTTTTKYSEFGVKVSVTAPAASDQADSTAALKLLTGMG